MKSVFARYALLPTLAALLLLGSGCETEDDDYDHTPPAGQGSLIVDNFTATDLEVFVDGRLAGEVRDDRDRAFDLAPGVHRVVLNDDDGDRTWADDVDILEGRLTVLRVLSGGLDSYSVTREIQ